MAASQTELLLVLLDSLSATNAAADAFFSLAEDVEATAPNDARTLRAIGRTHRVRGIELEAHLAAATEWRVRLWDGPEEDCA